MKVPSRIFIWRSTSAKARGFTCNWAASHLTRSVNPDGLVALLKPGCGHCSPFYYFLEIERSRQKHYRRGEIGACCEIERYYQYQRSANVLFILEMFQSFRVVIFMDTHPCRKSLDHFEMRFPRVCFGSGLRKKFASRCSRTPAHSQTAPYSLFENDPGLPLGLLPFEIASERRSRASLAVNIS